MASLAEGVKRLRGQGRRVAVAIVDLANFKSVNDNHGKQAGDRVLVQTAAVLES